MGVEVVAGLRSNCLALVSDGAHMLIDSAAVAVGLAAAAAASLPADASFGAGYGRAEPLAVFANGLLLLLIGGGVGAEAARRLLAAAPPPIDGGAALPAAAAGLAVNLIGLALCSHSHMHAGGECCAAGGDAAGAGGDNLRAVAMHALADACGFRRLEAEDLPISPPVSPRTWQHGG